MQDEKRIVRIAAEDSDGGDRILVIIPRCHLGHIPLDPVCQPLRVIELACADRPLENPGIEQRVLHRLRAAPFGCVGPVSTGDFSVKPAEVAVPPHVQAEPSRLYGVSYLEVDRLIERGASRLNAGQTFRGDGVILRLRPMGNTMADSGSEFDRQNPTVE